MASNTSIMEGVERLSRRDPTLKHLRASSKLHIDEELAELVDCLLAHPNVVEFVDLSYNRLTDETGVKLARYLATSSTVMAFVLGANLFGEATYLALAAALRVNSSLQYLYLNDNPEVDQTHIDAAFIEALRVNPVRPAESVWWLYSSGDSDVDLERLKEAAQQSC